MPLQHGARPGAVSCNTDMPNTVLHPLQALLPAAGPRQHGRTGRGAHPWCRSSGASLKVTNAPLQRGRGSGTRRPSARRRARPARSVAAALLFIPPGPGRRGRPWAQQQSGDVVRRDCSGLPLSSAHGPRSVKQPAARAMLSDAALDARSRAPWVPRLSRVRAHASKVVRTFCMQLARAAACAGRCSRPSNTSGMQGTQPLRTPVQGARARPLFSSPSQ